MHNKLVEAKGNEWIDEVIGWDLERDYHLSLDSEPLPYRYRMLQQLGTYRGHQASVL
jgi:hypothetical protein